MKKIAWLLVLCLLLSAAAFAEQSPQETASGAITAAEPTAPVTSAVSAASLAALQNAELAATTLSTSGILNGGVLWSISNGHLQFSGSGAIPDYGHNDKDTDSWPPYLLSAKNANVTTIHIGTNITKIGNSAFWGLDSLRTVVLNSGSKLTAIGDNAFSNCSNLCALKTDNAEKLPDTLTAIGENAFEYCPALKSLGLCNTKLETIGQSAFINDPDKPAAGLTSISLPDTLTSIGQYAFQRTALTALTLPQNVTALPTALCLHCSALKTVTLPDGLTSIGDSALAYCEALETVDSAKTKLTSIEKAAFFNCTSLKTLRLPDTLTSIGASTFYGISDDAYCNNGDSVRYLGNDAHPHLCLVSGTQCTVDKLTIPEDTRVIGYCAFYSKSGISKPKTVTTAAPYINYGAFYQCADVTGITLQDGVETIGELAFASCGKVTALSLPKTLKTIGRSAFNSWSSLREVSYGGTAEDWGKVQRDGNSDLVDRAVPIVVPTDGRLYAAEYHGAKMTQCRIVENAAKTDPGTTLLVRFPKALQEDGTAKAFVLDNALAPAAQ